MMAPALLVSTFGDLRTGGGLVLLDGGEATTLDVLSTVGLHVEGDRLYRVLRSSSESEEVGEALVYDTVGVRTYHRLDAVNDAHDAVVFEGRLLVVSTGTNSVVEVLPDGEQRTYWRGPVGGDSWHLNSLVEHEGALIATAFGRFRAPREWAAPGVARGAGVVFDLRSGEDLVHGLTQPHDPRPWRGGWVVCDSGNHALVHSTGKDLRTVQLDGWTRGLAVTDTHLFVGLSRSRLPGGRDRAAVAVVDAESFALVDLVELQHEEVFDVVVLPELLQASVAAGFRTNALRNEEQDLHELFRSVGQRPAILRPLSEPLDAEARRCTLQATAELTPTGDTIRLTVQVANNGNGYFLPLLPYPVQVAVRVRDLETGLLWNEVARLRLPRAVAPGQDVEVSGPVGLPAGAGPVELTVTLVQENVAWFDEDEETNRAVLMLDRGARQITA